MIEFNRVCARSITVAPPPCGVSMQVAQRGNLVRSLGRYRYNRGFKKYEINRMKKISCKSCLSCQKRKVE
jgi:hypothetical protein